MLLLVAMQYKTTLWILDTFHTLSTSKTKTLTSLIPIYLYFKKLVKQSCLKTATLLSQYILMFLLSAGNLKNTYSYAQLLALLNNV